jgi:murein DD-endopeptidase MepM/ murein hydrolase activator NlpD
MGGKQSDKVIKNFLFLLSISIAFLATNCAKHQVVVGKGPPPAKRGVYHLVERHQTLYRICKTYKVDMKEVAFLNRIADQSKIKTGQRIFIPGAKKVLKVEIYIDDVVTERGKEGEKKFSHKKLDFLWPVEGIIIDAFNDSENHRHQGIDIPCPLGTPIKASNPGTVIYSNNRIKGYGNLIILRHPDEFVTVYAHNQVNLVEEGSFVERGQIIAKVGQTGRATGPHLHFEIRRNNKAVDPVPYLK